MLALGVHVELKAAKAEIKELHGVIDHMRYISVCVYVYCVCVCVCVCV